MANQMTKSALPEGKTVDRIGPGTVLPFQRVPVQLGRRFSQVLMSVVSEVTSEHLVRNEMGLLVAISQVSGLDQKSLATLMAFDSTSVGQVIDALESKGLVRRVGSPTDRRVKHVEITKAGQSFVDETRPKILAAQRKALACLSEAERKTLLDLMARVIEANPEHDRPGGGRRAPTRPTG